MAEDTGKKKEDEKLEFTPEGETLGYISLDQAQVLAMGTARETPGAYAYYTDIPMAFDVLEAEETEDHYIIALSFRPQGEFAGRPGREQFFIEKEGNVAHRQVLALPRLGRGFPVIPVAVGLAVAAITTVIAVVAVVAVGGDNSEEPVSVAASPFDVPVSGTATPTGSISGGDAIPGLSTLAPGAQSTTSEGSSPPALQPLDAEAGLEYVPVRYSGGLEIFSGQRVAMSFTVPADGAITGVELLNVGHEACRADAALDFRLMATANGYPGAPVIHSVSIPPEDVDLEHSGFRIDLPEPWPVGANQTLAMELSTADDPATGGNCYYGWNGESPGTYRGGQAFSSSDGGQTWIPDRKDLAFRVFFRPDSPAAIPGSTVSPLVTGDLLSQPWGQSRRGDQPEEPWNERISLLTANIDHSTMYALNAEGCVRNCRLYRSSDQGKTWWPIELPFGWSGLLALRAVDVQEVYAWSVTEMWRSTDLGNQWARLDTPTGIANPGVSPYIRAFAGSPDIPYLVTADQNYPSGGLFQSQDKGASWRLVSGWLPGITLLSVAGDPPLIYTAWRNSQSNGLQWSSDGGRSWDSPRDVATGEALNWIVTDFITDPSDAATLYVAVAGKGLLSISALNPGEHTLLWPSESGGSEVQSISAHPSKPGVLAMRTTHGLFVTLNGGRSWVPLHQAGYQIGNVLYQGLPEGANGPVVTTGSPWTICVGSVNGVWCHGGG